MRGLGWAVLLQWVRLGGGALVVLVASRFLSLADFGLFAAAYAPVRLVQMGLRGAILDCAALEAWRVDRRASVWAATLWAGGGASACLIVLAFCVSGEVGVVMMALSGIPLAQAVGAVPEGRLRAALKLRALAWRSGAAYAVATLGTMLSLWCGLGVWALVAFSVLPPALTSALALWMVPNRLRNKPQVSQMRALVWRAAPLAGRDLLAAAPVPLAQVGLALAVGLPAAGAFQLAARLAAVLDSLATAPLRYVALPMFGRGVGFWPVFGATAAVTLALFPMAWVTAPAVLPVLIGGDHASTVYPLVAPFCLWGTATALSMPFVQRASVWRVTHLAVRRAAGVVVGVCLLGGLVVQTGAVVVAWVCAGVAWAVSLWFWGAVARATGLVLQKPDVGVAVRPEGVR